MTPDEKDVINKPCICRECVSKRDVEKNTQKDDGSSGSYMISVQVTFHDLVCDDSCPGNSMRNDGTEVWRPWCWIHGQWIDNEDQFDAQQTRCSGCIDFEKSQEAKS